MTIQQVLQKRGIPIPPKRPKPIAWPERHVVGSDNKTPVPFHIAQHWAWDSESRWIAMCAGTQGGKTGWGPWWLAREIKLCGSGDYMAVTSTYDMFKLKMLPALSQVFVYILGIARYWSGDRLLEIRKDAKPTGQFMAKRSEDPMWARVILRSADSEGSLESGTVKGVWCDEAGQPRFTRASWAAIKRRLAIHEGRALITTTLYDMGWVKQTFIDEFEGRVPDEIEVAKTGAEARRYDDGNTCLIQYDSILNPAYPIGEFLKAQKTMPKDEFDMFWRGMSTRLRTLIYDCYDPKLHDIEDFPIPHDWPRFVGIDPLGEQVGALWLAFDPQGEKLYAYREHLAPFGLTTEGHVKGIVSLCPNERILAWAGGGPSERQPRTDWMAHGIDLQSPTEDPALKSNVWSQIMRVYAAINGGDLKLFKSLVNLKAELGSYQRYKNKSTGEMTDRILNDEKFHLLSCLRYIVTWMTDPVEERQILYLPQVINRHLR